MKILHILTLINPLLSAKSSFILRMLICMNIGCMDASSILSADFVIGHWAVESGWKQIWRFLFYSKVKAFGKIKNNCKFRNCFKGAFTVKTRLIHLKYWVTLKRIYGTSVYGWINCNSLAIKWVLHQRFMFPFLLLLCKRRVKWTWS